MVFSVIECCSKTAEIWNQVLFSKIPLTQRIHTLTVTDCSISFWGKHNPDVSVTCDNLVFIEMPNKTRHYITINCLAHPGSGGAM